MSQSSNINFQTTTHTTAWWTKYNSHAILYGYCKSHFNCLYFSLFMTRSHEISKKLRNITTARPTVRISIIYTPLLLRSCVSFSKSGVSALILFSKIYFTGWNIINKPREVEFSFVYPTEINIQTEIKSYSSRFQREFVLQTFPRFGFIKRFESITDWEVAMATLHWLSNKFFCKGVRGGDTVWL